MPSRPMLITPERSDHSPPRPARKIGTARRSAALTVPLDVTGSASSITRTSDSSTSSRR